jgi:hypothetical protein
MKKFRLLMSALTLASIVYMGCQKQDEKPNIEEVARLSKTLTTVGGPQQAPDCTGSPLPVEETVTINVTPDPAVINTLTTITYGVSFNVAGYWSGVIRSAKV